MPQRPDDIHPLLLAWARWHAAQGMTGCSSLARVIERSRVGLASGAGTVRHRVRVETDDGPRYETREVWQAPQRDTRSTSRSAPPLGVEAPADVLRVAEAMYRVAATGKHAAQVMDTIRVHYLAPDVPRARRLAVLEIGEDMYYRRIGEGRRLLRLALEIGVAQQP